MRLIVARCATSAPEVREEFVERLYSLFRSEAFDVQPVDLPPLDELNPLRCLASWRLLPVESMTDALLCLDDCAAILRHSRKVVWLLGDYHELDLSAERRDYRSNVVAAAVKEAGALFARAPLAGSLKAAGFRHAKPLEAEAICRSNPGRGRRVKPSETLLRALRS